MKLSVASSNEHLAELRLDSLKILQLCTLCISEGDLVACNALDIETRCRRANAFLPCEDVMLTFAVSSPGKFSGLSKWRCALFAMDSQTSLKRSRPSDDLTAEVRAKRSAFLGSLTKPVSPPHKGKSSPVHGERTHRCRDQLSASKPISSPQDVAGDVSMSANHATHASQKVLTSPFQLMKVTGLPAQDNIDTVSLHDVLGDPLIKQAWIFNFCFDINWTMQHFDQDVRDLVDVKIVHGSWRKEDGNRLTIQEHLKNWKNVQEIQAYMPDAFGTHHSKMIILFKHDDTAQVIIHTANMLEQDWEHMTQAVWRSPLLPLLQDPAKAEEELARIGSGARFKHDLLRYTKAYGSKLKLLTEQLTKHDFSEVKAALLASVPSFQQGSDPPLEAWGHLALRNVLASRFRKSNKPTTSTQPQHLVSQVSSIARLPATWLDETIYTAATPPPVSGKLQVKPPTTSIIYPTPSDMRNALTGYATGGSIHTKVQSTAQQKQVTLLRPQFNRWGAQSSNSSTQARRHNIPPHIKTYICYNSKSTSSNPTPDIDWALVTSANLSTQAWGTAPKLPKGVKDPDQAVVHIQSFEIGVLVWPELFLDEHDDEGKKARMVPVFGKDMPEIQQTLSSADAHEVFIGMRMPYDLPLTPYAADEMPWSPGATYIEPDRFGRTWG